MSGIEKSPAYGAAVGRIRELLSRWLESGIDLFLALREIEYEGTWRIEGDVGFQDFLHREFPNALGLERYSNVIAAIDLHGVEFVRKIGVHACHTVSVRALVEQPKRAAAVRAKVDEHIRLRGCSPDVNKIRDLVLEEVPEARRPSQEARSLSERMKAQQQIRALRERVSELEAECERLTKELAACVGTARKPGAKPSKSKGSSGARAGA
jgi:hypothetical protein